jgi:mannose-6-phosphate isomerase-like protein (cupin superfamily)
VGLGLPKNIRAEREVLEPLVVKFYRLKEYASKREKGIKIVSSILLPHESLWKAGEWSEGDIFINRKFELGFFTYKHYQDFHTHTHSFEIYILMGEGIAVYLDPIKNCIINIKINKGDIIIFPPKIYHYIKLENGFGYNLLVRTEEYPGISDKVILESNDLQPCDNI